MEFSVLVERDEDGYYIASVPELPGCHTQAKTLDQLTSRIKEAIELYLEADGTKPEGTSKKRRMLDEVKASAPSALPSP